MAPTFEKVSNNYIPYHMSLCILSKLPVKSLKRFSCVQKSWNHLFQNPNFMNMFRNNFISKSHSLSDENDACLLLSLYVRPEWHCNLYLLSGDNFESKVKLDLPPPFHIQPTLIRILGCVVNGILCIYDNDKPLTVVLWNPATNEVKVIPPCFAELSHEVEVPAYSTLHGFGYDRVRDDYKVIQHVSYISLKKFRWDDVTDDVIPDPFWEIYSIKDNSWRKLDFDMPTSYMTTCSEVYTNGVCHWLGTTNDETCVVSFNLSSEVFFITLLPFNYSYAVSLMMLNGSVTMISDHRETNSIHISILGEFGVRESWVRLFDVVPFTCIYCPIGAGKKDNIFFIKENDKLVCFNLTTGMIEEIGVIGEMYWSKMVIYEKNLHPIGGINN